MKHGIEKWDSEVTQVSNSRKPRTPVLGKSNKGRHVITGVKGLESPS